jgi:hypothetical protein
MVAGIVNSTREVIDTNSHWCSVHNKVLIIKEIEIHISQYLPHLRCVQFLQCNEFGIKSFVMRPQRIEVRGDAATNQASDFLAKLFLFSEIIKYLRHSSC